MHQTEIARNHMAGSIRASVLYYCCCCCCCCRCCMCVWKRKEWTLNYLFVTRFDGKYERLMYSLLSIKSLLEVCECNDWELCGTDLFPCHHGRILKRCCACIVLFYSSDRPEIETKTHRKTSRQTIINNFKLSFRSSQSTEKFIITSKYKYGGKQRHRQQMNNWKTVLWWLWVKPRATARQCIVRIELRAENAFV